MPDTVGSPPPMRGKVANSAPTTLDVGITPAYAGKSVPVQCIFCQVEDHPRLCGEKVVHNLHIKRYTGSPPPMRGKASTSCFFSASYRITPAYAGKRVNFSIAHNAVWDHPRLCGEKTVARMSEAWNRGSPPPMRGKVCSQTFSRFSSRITPAYAGKSSQTMLRGFAEKDHPRLCGEKRDRCSIGKF